MSRPDPSFRQRGQRGPAYEQFQRGDSITHPAYGTGMVISQHEDLVFCAFEGGHSLTVRVGQLKQINKEELQK